MSAFFQICFLKIPWLLLKKLCKWSILNTGQTNHAYKTFAAAQRHNYCVSSFAIVVGACATIHGQHWMKTVLVEMTMVLLKRLMTMALQTNNKDKLFYLILSDSLIYKFFTGLFDLLGCYWKINIRNWVIILSLKTAYWCYESSHISKTSFSDISSFKKVDQRKLCHPLIYNSTKFDDMKILPYQSPCKNSAILYLPHFQKLLIGARSSTHWFYNLEGNYRLSNQKKSMPLKLLVSTLWPLDCTTINKTPLSTFIYIYIFMYIYIYIYILKDLIFIYLYINIYILIF